MTPKFKVCAMNFGSMDERSKLLIPFFLAAKVHTSYSLYGRGPQIKLQEKIFCITATKKENFSLLVRLHEDDIRIYHDYYSGSVYSITLNVIRFIGFHNFVIIDKF